MRQFLTSDTSPFPDRFGNGSDGALTISSNTTEAPTDASCSGTSGTTTLSATNGSFAANQLILIHQTRGTGAGNWELNKISSYTAGTITTLYALQNTYTDSGASQAQVRVLLQYSSVTINSGITYTAKAWDGDVGGILAYLCNGLTTVTGTISANGAISNQTNSQNQNGGGFRGGRGGNSKNDPGTQGEGTAGASGTVSVAANGNGGGGADSPDTTGGTTAGVAALTTMVFGGAGGGSESDTQVNYQSGQGNAGGNGAGIVLIISKTITVTGSVTSTGGNGRDDSDCAGSGSGAGGSILFKGQIVTLGSTLVTASGGTQINGSRYQGAGGGGHAAAGSDTDASGTGGAGSVGRIHADYSSTISGTTNPTLDSSQDSIFTDRGGGAFFGLM